MNQTLCTVYDCEFDDYLDGVIIENKVYVLDEQNNPVPPREHVCPHVNYDMVQFYIGVYPEPLYEEVEDTSKWGFIELSTGEIIVPPIYDHALPFYGDRAQVIKNGKYGFIDYDGELVVEPIWDEAARAFLDELCWVRKGEHYGYIDKNGKVIVEPEYELAESFKRIGQFPETEECAALVKKNGKCGFIDKAGHYIFEPFFDHAKAFWHVGYAPVMIRGKWGLIDEDLNIVFPQQTPDVKYRNQKIYIDDYNGKVYM